MGSGDFRSASPTSPYSHGADDSIYTIFLDTTESAKLHGRFIDKRFLPKPSARRQPAGTFFAMRTGKRGAQSEQLSVPNGGFGKFHSKRLPVSVMQVRVCVAFAVADAGGGGEKVRAAQGEVMAAARVAARMTRQPVSH